jgi:hypothetical protein
VFISTPLLFILSTQRAHTRHLLWQGPLRHWISCVYINTSTFHSVNTASSHSSPSVARRSPLAKPVLDLSNMSEGIRKETVEATLQIHQRYDLQTIPQARANKNLKRNRLSKSPVESIMQRPCQNVRGYPEGDRRFLKKHHRSATMLIYPRVYADDIKQYKTAEFADSDLGFISDTIYRLSLKRKRTRSNRHPPQLP